MRGSFSLGYWLLVASACAAHEPIAETPRASVEAAAPTPSTEPSPPRAVAPETLDRSATAFCDSPKLALLLAEFEAGEKSLGDTGRARPLAVGDLEPVTVTAGTFGDASAGPGVFGSLDADGDGRPDVVLHYASVDYWSWLVFIETGGCLRFVDRLDGYQVEFSTSSHGGMRDARVLTYPLQGRIETLRFDGSRYQP